MSRLPLAALAACAALSLAAVRATADVDVELRSGDQVTGTLDPGTEVETFRFQVPAGAKLTVKAKALKKGPPTSLVLRSGATDLLDGTERGPLAAVTGYSVSATASLAAVVTSRDGAARGDYSFSAKWSLPRTRTEALVYAESARETLPFSADAGTRVRITATAARGSSALPRIASLTGPGGAVGGVGDATGGRTDSAGPAVLPETGDYVLEVANDGGDGEVTVKLAFTPAKRKARKIDLTARTTGTAGADGAYARVVDAEGGVVAVPAGIVGLEELVGTSVTIPTGALPLGSAIFVGTAPDLRLGSGDLQQVGAPVSFGPDGTTFGTKADPKQATLSIPYDLAAVGGDTSKVRVFTRDARGRESLIEPPYDFSRPGFVSFPTSHFSAYVAAAEDTGSSNGPAVITLAGGLFQGFDLAYALTGSAPGRTFYFADGSDVVKDISTNGTGGFVVGSYAGGGTLVQDGSDKLQFDFPGVITAVYSSADAVFVGTSAFTVYRIDDETDQVTRILGDGIEEDSGDDGPATSARIRNCADLYEDSDGNLWVIDAVAARARRIDVNGTITTFAGTGTNGSNGDGNAASATRLQAPSAIVERPATTDMLLAELGRVRILHVDTDSVETLAGDPAGATGCAAGGEVGTAARFDQLSGIAFDIVTGRVLVSSEGCDAIYGIHQSTKLVDVVAGQVGAPGFTPDGSGGTLRLTNPRALLGTANVLFLIDFGGGATDVRVREVVIPTE